MTLEQQIEHLEKRLTNSEMAMLGMMAFIAETLPKNKLEEVSNLLSAFFDANVSFGSDFNHNNEVAFRMNEALSH